MTTVIAIFVTVAGIVGLLLIIALFTQKGYKTKSKVIINARNKKFLII